MHAENNIPRELLAAELDHICESLAFRHSHRQQQFLCYLVDCKLAGRLIALREIALGIDCFRRPANTYRATSLIDRILKGTNPADLPFEQATRFHVSINIKTAKSLGITVPASVMARADEVID